MKDGLQISGNSFMETILKNKLIVIYFILVFGFVAYSIIKQQIDLKPYLKKINVQQRIGMNLG